METAIRDNSQNNLRDQQSHFKSLFIENFQSHLKTTIDLSQPGELLVITGASDSGKTAIIRAMRWLLFNEPQGSDFIRVGASFARVTLEMSNGTRVIRERGKSYNRYIVVTSDGERQVYEGFGGNVPFEVMEITGVKHATVGDMELNLNLSSQLEGPFLGSSVSAPARAKVLGKLAGTEEIDHAGKTVGTDLHGRKGNKTAAEAEVKRLTGEIEAYDYLPTMAKTIEAVENIVGAVKGQQNRRDRLAERREALRQVLAGIEEAERVWDQWRHLEDAMVLVDDAEFARRSVAALMEQARALDAARAGIADAEAVIDRLTGLDEAGEIVGRVQDLMTRHEAVKRYREGLVTANAGISSADVVLARTARVGEAEEAARQVFEMMQWRSRLKGLAVDYSLASRGAEANEAAMKRTAGIVASEDAANKVERLTSRRDNIIDLSVKFREADAAARKAHETATLWEQHVAEAQGAYQDLLAQTGICPVCGSNADPKKIKEVI